MQNSGDLNGARNHGRTPRPYDVPDLECIPPSRRRSRSRSRSPARRRRQHTSSDERRSSSEVEDRGQTRKMARQYKKKKGRDESFPIDGHTPFPNRILRVQLPRHFVKPTDMKSDGSIDPLIHMNTSRTSSIGWYTMERSMKLNVGPSPDNQWDSGFKGQPKPLKQKFNNYTPLVAPITEIYQQIFEKGVLPRARPLKGRTHNARNISLFCDYHQGYGHKTQDCYDLKDVIEQPIRDGKLSKFAKIST
ncbi:hypothetical protein PIB30_050430 [Stylosanthes scabra]|uniref:Uncharacterized protein n=1 Tax=Stylosanthes scabra TaxID=79078 RepID=A0ABU6ZGC1_9FABA|nr:hypothetical protein [Stylosanthes scabra]